MGSDAVVTFTGRADQLLQTYTQMNSANTAYDKGLGKLAISTRELNKLEREGLAITKMNLTAKERYTENVNLARKALDYGKISMESYNRELARQKQLLEQAEGGGERFTGVLKGIGAAAGTAVAGIQALIAEEQKLANLKRQSADTNVAYGEILARTVNNFSDDATLKKEQLDEKFAGIQDRVKVRDRKAIARVAGEAFSAKGNLTNDETLGFVEAGFAYSPDDEATANTFATRSLDVAKATGVKDPKAIMGWLGQTQKAARVARIEALGSEGVQAMLGAQVYGASPEQSAELFATLNSLLVDVQGANSKTAMLSMSGQLMDDEKIKKAGLDKAFAGKSLMGRIGMMQKDSTLAKKFMGEASFEVAAKPFIEKFLSGEKSAMAEYASVREAVPALDANAAKAFDKMIAERDAMPHAEMSRQDRAREAATQSKELSEMATRGRAGLAQRTFEETLDKADLPGFDKGIDIPIVTGLSSAVGLPIRIPGTETMMKNEAWMRENIMGQDPAKARAETLRGVTGEKGFFSGGRGTVGGTDLDFVKQQRDNLQAQSSKFQEEFVSGPERKARQQFADKQAADKDSGELLAIQKAQLEELKRLNSMRDSAPPQPLLNGGNEALKGAPQ